VYKADQRFASPFALINFEKPNTISLAVAGKIKVSKGRNSKKEKPSPTLKNKTLNPQGTQRSLLKESPYIEC